MHVIKKNHSSPFSDFRPNNVRLGKLFEYRLPCTTSLSREKRGTRGSLVECFTQRLYQYFPLRVCTNNGSCAKLIPGVLDPNGVGENPGNEGCCFWGRNVFHLQL